MPNLIVAFGMLVPASAAAGTKRSAAAAVCGRAAIANAAASASREKFLRVLNALPFERVLSMSSASLWDVSPNEICSFHVGSAIVLHTEFCMQNCNGKD